MIKLIIAIAFIAVGLYQLDCIYSVIIRKHAANEGIFRDDRREKDLR